MRTLFQVALSLSASLLFSTASAQSSDCDENCMIDIATQYMSDVVEQDWSNLPWADQVRFTENNVGMMIGDGFWGAVGGAEASSAFTLADPSTGNVLWYGITDEHGAAAYYGMRMKIEHREITEVETYLGREGTPDLFTDTSGYSIDSVYSQSISSAQQRPRERMVAIVDGYFNTKQLNDGALYTAFDSSCTRITNGVNITEGEHWTAQAAEGCQAQMEIGVYRPVDRVRARHYPLIDVEKGIVVALSIEDHATRYVDYKTLDGQDLNVEVEYPNSRGMLEVFKITDGEISHIEGISVFLPYYIQSLWD